MSREKDRPEITRLLAACARGDAGAEQQLAPEVYAQLREIAAACFAGRGGGTLQPTALVHEAWLRMFGGDGVEVRDRAHFFALASKVMHGLLVDHARARGARKRGGGRKRVTLAEAGVTGSREVDVLDLTEALAELEALDPEQHQVVTLRYFGGLEMAEIAEVRGTSKSTVEREWRAARAWLGVRLKA